MHRRQRDEHEREARHLARPEALLAGELRGVREEEREERDRGQVRRAVPAEDVLGDREHRPQAGGEHAGEISPERAREREHRQDRRDREHPDPVGEHGRWLAAQLEERAVERRHARVLAERHSEHPEGVVEQERAVAGDLVGVEEVLGPVVSGNRVAADHALLEQHADARPRAPGRRPPAGPPARARAPRSGQGSARPIATRPASVSLTTTPSSGAPRLATVIRATAAAANPSAGQAASTATGLSRTRAGRSGASARPGASASAASREQRRGGAGRAEQRLERDDRDRAHGQRPSPQPTQHLPEYRDPEARCDSHSA